jgi:hypothetical protein
VVFQKLQTHSSIFQPPTAAATTAATSNNIFRKERGAQLERKIYNTPIIFEVM